MSRYVDIEPLEKEIERELTIGDIRIFSEFEEGVFRVYDAIKRTPTADVEEARHGEWISELVKKCDWKGNKQSYYQPISCSLCHEPQAIKYPYCPACGARMDGGKE